MEWEPPTPDGQFFDGPSLARIKALFSRIFTARANEGVPGAIDAGAFDYLDHLLVFEASVYREIPKWRALYRHALPILNEAALHHYDTNIENLTADQLDAFLTALSSGSLAGLPDDFGQIHFFSTLRQHCLQGCFSDSRWGGNADDIMWRWLGYQYDREDFS